MAEEEFVQQLQIWKQELTTEVISHFRSGNRERGQLAFDRWKERFTAFLEEHVPVEAQRFTEKTHHIGSMIIPGEHPHEAFMRKDGKICLAFIDDLAESALKGRVTDLQKKIAEPKKLLVSSPKVFLSYAREDMNSAQRLFDDLRNAGADVWFDQVSLLPGQKWKTAIWQAIGESRFFLALLSTKSVNKMGYVQKELREALDVLDRYPESAIFLIPVRLDNCHPSHDRLRDLKWVDMFPDWNEGLARILKALQTQ